MSKKIGLEIGTAKTKIVVGQMIKSDFKITGYEVFDTLDGVYTIDDDIDLVRMELPVREALDRLKIKKGDLHVSINNEKVIIRTRELPRVSPKEMVDIVRFEAENFLPYDIDAFYIDYKILDEVDEKEVGETDEKQVFFNVMIIAAPKECVNQYIELAERLKLKLKIVTVYTEASTKFFTKHFLEDNKNTLFVDIGNKYTNMTMFEGFHYFANIKTERGMKGMYERLVDHHGFNEHDVKYYLFNYNSSITQINKEQIVDTSTEKNSLKNLQKRLASIQKAKTNLSETDSDLLALRNREYDNIINEISRMLEFFRSRKYGTYADQIYLFGGGAYLSSFASLIEESLDVKCEILPNKAYSHLLDKENYELMIPSIGACLGGKS